MKPIIVDNKSLVLDAELINYLMALWPKGSEKSIQNKTSATYQELLKLLGNKLYGWENNNRLHFTLSYDYRPTSFVFRKAFWSVIFMPMPYCEAVVDGESVWSFDNIISDYSIGTKILEILGTTREAKEIQVADVEQVTILVLCNDGPDYLETYVEQRSFWKLR